MTKELPPNPEQNENELLQSIVEDGKTVAVRLQDHFGQVFYPMKFVELPACKIAYSNPGGDYPLSLRMHQVRGEHTAGVEVSLFFKHLPGTGGQELRLFEDEQSKSNISDSNISGSAEDEHAYYFIHQQTDGSLAASAGLHSPPLDLEKLQEYSAFVGELPQLLDEFLQENSPR